MSQVLTTTQTRTELLQYQRRLVEIKDEMDDLQTERAVLEMRVARLRREYFPSEVDEP